MGFKSGKSNYKTIIMIVVALVIGLVVEAKFALISKYMPTKEGEV